MLRLLTAVLLGVLTALPLRAAEIPEAPSEAAMTFVAGFSDDHLSGMLSRIGARQPPMIAMSQANGQLLEQVFNLQIDEAVREHGPTWQANMARAWTPLLTDEELTSLTTAGAQSPHVDKYLGLRTTAGESMGELSQDLFREILAQVIDKTIAAMNAVTDKP